MKHILRKTALLLAALMLTAAGALAEGRPIIVATDFPCYDFARQVAGEHADVTMLLKPGAEAHTYDPAPTDLLLIDGADLFVYIGGESDAWVEGMLSGFDGTEGPARLKMMDAVDALLEEEGDEGHVHDGGEPEYDEHIWTDPRNAVRMVRAAADALCAVDEANADEYRRAAEAYIAEIDAVDAAFREVVDGAARREMIFADRFPFLYFARAYGLEYAAAFPSCTTDAEPSLQTVMALIQKVRDEGIPAVYAIELSTQSVARTIAEETGAEILTMHSIQTVTRDEFEAGETYVSLMWKNVAALRGGLY